MTENLCSRCGANEILPNPEIDADSFKSATVSDENPGKCDRCGDTLGDSKGRYIIKEDLDK